MKDHAGWTALHEACNHGYAGCVQELLEARQLVYEIKPGDGMSILLLFTLSLPRVPKFKSEKYFQFLFFTISKNKHHHMKRGEGGWDGAVGFNVARVLFWSGIICGLSLLLVLMLAGKAVSPGTPALDRDSNDRTLLFCDARYK